MKITPQTMRDRYLFVVLKVALMSLMDLQNWVSGKALLTTKIYF